MYNKILVPLDGSPLAECALPYVERMMHDRDMEVVTLLRVVDVNIPGRGEIPGILDINAVRENFFAESRAYLAGAASRLASHGPAVKTVSLESSRPADTISDYAEKNGMELIVIATHGYTGVKKLMFGSVALGVLHESRIPVLLIRPETCPRDSGRR
ncbi:MAG: universal stress protein [Syntrophales bacterium]